jgi:hypothetical protein
MNEKINFLKEKKELAEKIILLYKALFNFEKKKNKRKVAINPKGKDEKPKSTIFENKRSI